MFSSIMAIALLMTSSLMIILYANYCDFLNRYRPSDDLCADNYADYPPNCGDNETHFLILPLFGFSAMVAWVR